MDLTAANYVYWREHGAEWHTEYQRRKKLQVCYHSQEIMIAEYLRHCAPARVLEFGCGSGRHLRYLNVIPGLEVYGYDQSPQMVAGMQAWAEPDWLKSRVHTGPAVGKLPYPDGAFDVVFTAEVLVHVRPEHLASILAELIRVARWQVIHFETSEDFPLDANSHNGCWYHDLCRAYGEKGLSCETLPAGYRAHQPYRVVRDASRPLPEASHVLPMLLRRLETDLQGTLAGWAAVGRRLQRLAAAGEQATAVAEDGSDPVALASNHCDLISARIDAERDARTRAEQANAAAEQANAALSAELAALRCEANQLRADLARLESSLGHRVLRRLRRMPGFGLLHGALQAVRAVCAQGNSAVSGTRGDGGTRRPWAHGARPTLRLKPPSGPAPDLPTPLPAAWQFVHANPAIPVVSICHPRWQGVRSVAEGHSPNRLFTPEIASSEIETIAESLLGSGATHFISEGFFEGYAELLARLRQRMPKARIFCVMHGSFFQMIDNAEVPRTLRQLDSLRREGVLDRVGFSKPGMAQALQRLGYPACEVMNRMPGPATLRSRSWRSPARVFIPVGALSRKNPHTQLIGALLAEDVDEIHVATSLDLQYLPAGAMKKAHVKVHENLGRAQTWQLIEQSDLVLYATISECAPVVPLESLAVGVPCLTGNNHRLFDDIPELLRLLVVSREDDAWAIAEAMDRVRREYKSCCDLIRQFNECYDRKAVKNVADFLELEVDAYNPPAAVQKAA